jgi:MOSC domain-containing protein YiiM
MGLGGARGRGPTTDGRVVSVNVAVVSTAAWTGRMGRSGMDKRPVPGPVRLGPSGVAGDTVCDTAFHGGPHQAVYAYAVEDVAYWVTELHGPIPPGGMGENLTLSGVDCSGAVVGERWRVGDAVLVVTGPRVPCRVFAGFRQVRPTSSHASSPRADPGPTSRCGDPPRCAPGTSSLCSTGRRTG